jgi:hypothetical protein
MNSLCQDETNGSPPKPHDFFFGITNIGKECFALTVGKFIAKRLRSSSFRLAFMGEDIYPFPAFGTPQNRCSP